MKYSYRHFQDLKLYKMLSLTAETLYEQTVSKGLFFFSNRQEVMMLWYVFFFIVPSSFRLIIEDKIPWSLKLIVKETGDLHKRQLYAEIKSRLQASCSWHNISIYIRKRINIGCIVVLYVRCK